MMARNGATTERERSRDVTIDLTDPKTGDAAHKAWKGSVREALQSSARWRLGAMAPGEGYTGALATDGPARLAFWQWPPTEAPVGLRGAQTGPDRG
jgi:hypothetical protein